MIAIVKYIFFILHMTIEIAFCLLFGVDSNLTIFLYLLTSFKHPRSLITFIVSDNRLKRLTLQKRLQKTHKV